MRPCPTCGQDQADFATRCSECQGELPPPTGAVPIDPLLEMRATLRSKELALTEAATALTNIKREAEKKEADLRQRAESLAIENEKLRADASGAAASTASSSTTASSTTTTAAAPATGVWGSAALIALLRKWPRVATAATALMTLATAYGGFGLGKTLTQDNPPSSSSSVVTSASADATAALTKERDDANARAATATKERDTVSEQLAAMTKERDTASAQAAAATKERTDVAARMTAMEGQLGNATKEIAAANTARDQAMVRANSVMARGNVAAPAPRPPVGAGFVDIIVPRGATNSEISVQRGRSLLLPGGAWPTGECTLVAGDPRARFQGVQPESVGGKRRTTTITGVCNAAMIVVKKSQDWGEGDIVRLFWQLRQP